MLAPGLGDFHDGAPLLAALLLAFALDWLIGDPPALYRRLPHPVAAIGALIAFLDRHYNRGSALSGAAVSLAVVMGCAALGWGLAFGFRAFPGGWAAEALVASSLLASRGLHDAVGAVARGLGGGLAEGRAAVAHIVGRDPQSLDAAGVARAAIESAAENLGDGVVAPLFWYALFGLPGMLACKAINTLDSMIGHRTLRYQAFGRFAARVDDAINWLPARLAGLLICLAAALARRADAAAAWRAMVRDAGKAVSPNAGWPEAAMAGALGLALAGPRAYGERTVNAAWLGDGRRAATAADIRACLHLYRLAGAILAAILAGVVVS